VMSRPMPCTRQRPQPGNFPNFVTPGAMENCTPAGNPVREASSPNKMFDAVLRFTRPGSLPCQAGAGDGVLLPHWWKYACPLRPTALEASFSVFSDRHVEQRVSLIMA
jgi:hypothetical protein